MCLELYWSNLLGVAGPSAQKENSFGPQMANNCQFLAKNSVFLENNWVGGTPLSYFEVAELKKKGFLWSFWAQYLFSWYFCAYTIGYRYAGVQHCSVAPPHNRQKYSKIGRVQGFLIIWGKARMRGTPPSVFWGKRIPTKGQFLSKILYRQVHWCAALFCRTSPEQAKIPQNTPNFKVFDIFGQSRVGGPLPHFWAVETKRKRSFPAKIPFLLTF